MHRIVATFKDSGNLGDETIRSPGWPLQTIHLTDRGGVIAKQDESAVSIVLG